MLRDYSLVLNSTPFIEPYTFNFNRLLKKNVRIKDVHHLSILTKLALF